MGVDVNDVMAVFAELEDVCEPLLAMKVTDRLDCSHTTARERLHDCVSMGELRTKKLGPVRAFWLPAEDWDPSTSGNDA